MPAGRSSFSPKARIAHRTRLGQSLPHAFHIEIGAVHGRIRLLPPGFVQAAGVHSVEAELIQQLNDDLLGPRLGQSGQASINVSASILDGPPRKSSRAKLSRCPRFKAS